MSEVVVGGIKLVFSNSFPSSKIDPVVQAVAALSGTEAGRIFLRYLPKSIKFNYFTGDSASRATSDPIFDTINLPETVFSSDFGRYDVIWHELAHQIQVVPKLEGAPIGSAGINR